MGARKLTDAFLPIPQTEQYLDGIERKSLQICRSTKQKSRDLRCRSVADLEPNDFRWRAANQRQATKIVIFTDDGELVVPGKGPNCLITRTAHAESIYVITVRPDRSDFSYQSRAQILVEKKFHAVALAVVT